MESSVATNAEFIAMQITPETVVVPAGQEVRVTVSLTQDAFTYSGNVPLSTGQANPIVTLSPPYMPAGQKSAEIVIRGVTPGEADISYMLVSFGSARGHIGKIGHVTVTAAQATPRPPAPAPRAVTMSPDPIELKKGSEASVFVTLAEASSSDVTFTSETRGVVEISGKIAAGKKAATLTVRGMTAGRTNILYSAGGTSGIAGRAIVEEPPPSRRRSSHS